MCRASLVTSQLTDTRTDVMRTLELWSVCCGSKKPSLGSHVLCLMHCPGICTILQAEQAHPPAPPFDTTSLPIYPCSTCSSPPSGPVCTLTASSIKHPLSWTPANVSPCRKPSVEALQMWVQVETRWPRCCLPFRAQHCKRGEASSTHKHHLGSSLHGKHRPTALVVFSRRANGCQKQQRIYIGEARKVGGPGPTPLLLHLFIFRCHS